MPITEMAAPRRGEFSTFDLPHCPESKIGIWFLSTRTWAVHVVRRALDDLQRLIPDPRARYSVILDVGVGWGHSLPLLAQRFAPSRLLAIDVEPEMLRHCETHRGQLGLPIECFHASASNICLPDESVDLLFCHQTFHHLLDQQGAIREFFRVLRPGGLLLFAESTRAYIESWIIRLFFRHPPEAQRSADEYLALIRGAGFEIAPESISLPYLWWSRADLGLAERLFGVTPPTDREETLLNLVAVKPPR